MLDDLNEYKDDIDEEKKLKETKNIKIMSKYFYRAVKNFKIKPENEITFVKIEQSK